MRPVALACLGLLLAGCANSPFAPAGDGLDFACLAIDPSAAGALRIDVLGAPPGNATVFRDGLRLALANATARPATTVPALQAPAPEPEGGAWNETSLTAWAGGRSYRDGGAAVLAVLWIDTLPDVAGAPDATQATGLVAAPGVLALARAPVEAAAARLGVAPERVALAVALHHAGHALGQVNDGIPVQARDIQDREGPPRHDRDPASVLHAGWDDGRTIVWAANATYDAYPASSLADWRGAIAPGGVCT